MQRTPKQGRKLKLSGKNGVNLRNKSEAASTPKVGDIVDSPPWLSESASCESSAPSPIPFLCTQDGSNGENDVVWNYYSPTSEKDSPTYRPIASDTPIRKRKKNFLCNDFSPVTRIPVKKKLTRPSLRKKEFLKELKEELMALNKNVQGLMCSEPANTPVMSPDANKVSPKSASIRQITDCLFDNVLEPVTESEDKYSVNTQVVPLKKNIFDKIAKFDNEGALESDDSMNEFLLQASQMVEEEHGGRNNIKAGDKLLRNKFSLSGKMKNGQLLKVGSPNPKNDSFDNLIGNMNDSEIELLTQATHKSANNLGKCNIGARAKNSSHLKKNHNKSRDNNNYFPITDGDKIVKNKNHVNNNSENTNWNDSGDNMMNNLSNLSNLMSSSMLKESRSKFSRHRSMPESPTAPQTKKMKGNGASTSFTRHNTMPSHTTDLLAADGTLSQTIKCTPEEIRKKHQAAREKLLARKQEPGSRKNSLSSMPSNPELDKIVPVMKLLTANNTNESHNVTAKHKESTINNTKKNSINMNNNKVSSLSKNIKTSEKSNLREEIERKRNEALQKLQMKKTFGSMRK